MRAEEIAQAFHEAYETLAPAHGYETREASRKPWEDVPEQNRGLMVAVVGSLIADRVIALPPEPEDTRTCRFCGCTDALACRGGCWWVGDDLCSACTAVSADSFADGLRAVATLAGIELRHAGVVAGYWLRPYDMALDRRRWRWSAAGCWRADPVQVDAVERLAAWIDGRPAPGLSVDGGPACSCGPDLTGEEPDYRETCDRHGSTPTALAWQESRFGGQTGEPPF